MKKIIMSLSVIAFVAAIAIVGTTAYFSDTETSKDNTFTAGELDLKIDNTCHYNGMVCTLEGVWQDEDDVVGNEVETEYAYIGGPCACTWEETDLTTHKFFDFKDIKPGDWGENTLSFHVIDNDAWGRVILTAIENREHLCTEPESDVDDTCLGRWCGELAQNMYSFVWVDNGINPGNPEDPTKGDNIWQKGEEVVTEYCLGKRVEGPNGQMYCQVLPDDAADYACNWSLGLTGDSDSDPQGDLPNDYEIVTIPLTGGIFLEDCETNYLGVAWYVPYSVNNIIQGDSIKADITFEIVQVRHNDPTDPFNVLP